jgi:hypothetical protein
MCRDTEREFSAIGVTGEFSARGCVAHACYTESTPWLEWKFAGFEDLGELRDDY